MLALDLFRNGRRQFRAGGFPDSILSASLMRASHVGEPPRWGVSVDIVAVTDVEIMEWTCEPLFPGDEFICRVVEAEDGDPPNVRRNDAEFEMKCEAKSLLQARTIYAGLKRRLLEMEAQWGDQL